MARFSTVIFDCDSTLSRLEGIEALAGAHQREISHLTEQAMAGAIPLDQVYGRRLELIRPSRQQVEQIAERYIEALLPDAGRVVRELQVHGVRVRIMSGGLRPAVLPLARQLGLAPEQVDAVDIRFDGSGEYAGFDERSPLAQGGGKRVLVEQLLREAVITRPVLLVGDGATDLEARPVVDLFLAFAGVARREPVVRGAEIVIGSLELLLPLVLGSEFYISSRQPQHA